MPIILPIKMPSKYYEMIRELLPETDRSQSFNMQVAKIWQGEKDESGDIVRKQQEEYIVYVEPDFMLYVYEVLASRPQSVTNWLNPDLKTRLSEQLSSPDTFGKIMKFNGMTQEQVMELLTDINTKIIDIEKRYTEAQNAICDAGYMKGLQTVVPDSSWPIK